MTKIISKSITVSLNKTKELMEFNIVYRLLSPQIGDEVKIYYSYFEFIDPNDWTEYSLVKDPVSYTVNSVKPSINLKEKFISTFSGRFRFKLSIFRNGVEIDSVIHKVKDPEYKGSESYGYRPYIDTADICSGPIIENLVFAPGSPRITWDWSYDFNKFNEFAISYFEVTVKYIGMSFSEIYITDATYGAVTFWFYNQLKPGLANFYIRAVDVAGRKSPNILINKKPYKIPLVTGINQLFDISSFWNKLNDLLSDIPEESSEYIENRWTLYDALVDASLRWSNYLRFSDTAYEKIQEFLYEKDCTDKFRGIRLELLDWYETNDPNIAAGCGPSRTILLDNTKYGVITFILFLNKNFLQYDYANMLRILTHELGHALGIGTLWDNGLNSSTDPVFPHSINGEKYFYPEAQKAYNQFVSKKRKYIPLNFDGIGVDSHWAHILNTTNEFTKKHPPVPQEIMSYGHEIGIEGKITPISLKFLVDIGYEEINPGTSDLDFIEILEVPNPSPASFGCSPTTDTIKIIGDFSDPGDILVYVDSIERNIDKKYDYIFTDTSNNEKFIVLNVKLQGNKTANPINIREDYGLNDVDDDVKFNGDISILTAIVDSGTYTNWESGTTQFSSTTIQTLSKTNNWKVYDLDKNNITISPAWFV